MPASHKTLANWYLQLAQHMEAGIPLAEAIECSSGISAHSRKQLSDQLRAGETIPTVINQAPGWLPSADRIFIIAAADSGRLPQTFANLHSRHKRIDRIQRTVIFSTIYPLGVYHLAACVLVFMRNLNYEAGLSSLNPALMGAQALALIVPLWALIALIIVMSKIESPLLPRLVRCVPLLRKYSKTQAVADLASSLGTFVETGVPIQRAWQYATSITSASEFKRAYRALHPIFEAGDDPAQLLPKLKQFPPDFCAYYQTGAQTGKLDESLKTVGEHYQDKANSALKIAAVTYPSILFALVAGMVAYTVISFYAGYLNMLQDFGN